MTFVNNIDNQDIQKLPLFAFEGEIVLVDTIEKYNDIKEYLFSEHIIGFDTETKPSFKKGVANSTPVSLLQLSYSNKTFLIRLNKIPIQNEIIKLFSSEDFLKVGVSIRDDIKALKKLKNFNPAGFVELQDFVKNFEITDASLKKLAAIILGKRVSKSQQLSNWAADVLTEKQMRYAATDSWISKEIYLKLNRIYNDRTQI